MAHGHGHELAHVDNPGPLRVSPALSTGLTAATVIGAILWVVALTMDGKRAWLAYLHGYVFFLDLAVGTMLFAAIQNVTSSQWIIPVRRVAEGLARNSFFAAAALFLGVLAGLQSTHRWATDSHMFHDALKSQFLSIPGAAAMGLVFFGVVGFLMRKIINRSLATDKAKVPGFVLANRDNSILFIIAFGVLYSLMMVVLVMSLEPHWFSTMFGVYNFAGTLLSSVSVIIIATVGLRKSGHLAQAVTPRHLHDLGTWLVAFSVFMIYIGFSQYMLIWYANLPEETVYMIKRTENGWGAVTLSLVFLKWIVPWLVLMSQSFRNYPPMMVAVACAVLVGQWLDIYWMIYPTWYKSVPMPGLAELGALGLFGGLFGLCATGFYRRYTVLAVGDPRLLSSVNGWYV